MTDEDEEKMRIKTLDLVYHRKTIDYVLYQKELSCYLEDDAKLFDATLNVRYNSTPPNKLQSIKIDDPSHRKISSEHLPLFSCPQCNKKDLYLTKFNNIRELNSADDQYSKLDMEYYCPNCKLEFQNIGF